MRFPKVCLNCLCVISVAEKIYSMMIGIGIAFTFSLTVQPNPFLLTPFNQPSLCTRQIFGSLGPSATLSLQTLPRRKTNPINSRTHRLAQFGRIFVGRRCCHARGPDRPTTTDQTPQRQNLPYGRRRMGTQFSTTCSIPTTLRARQNIGVGR